MVYSNLSTALEDTLGTLENELSVVNGTGSQPDTSNRWGDYSAMRIDPVDNCTFWYTTEYYMVTQRFDWSTRIASAEFSNCPSRVTSLSSFEVWNRSGSTVNEFREFMPAVDPSSITSTFNGDYPQATITGINGGTLIDWTGGTTPADTKSDFGISFSGNVDPSDSVAAWYNNGVQALIVIVDGQVWCQPGGFLWMDCLFGPGSDLNFSDDVNGSRSPSFPFSYVQRRVPPSPSGDLGLSDLFRDGTLWNEATLIDPNFVLVSHTIRALLYRYPQLPPGEWDVMMYDVLDENGQLTMTFGNAISPSP
jgi:hypothetical protein